MSGYRSVAGAVNPSHFNLGQMQRLSDVQPDGLQSLTMSTPRSVELQNKTLFYSYTMAKY